MRDRTLVATWVLAALFGWAIGQVLTVNTPKAPEPFAIAVTPDLLQEVSSTGRGRIATLKCGFSEEAFYKSMHEVDEEIRRQADGIKQLAYEAVVARQIAAEKTPKP